MRRAVLATAVITMAIAPAAFAAKTRSTVTMDAAFYGPGETQWAGDVLSKATKCRKNRTIKVFRVRPGADQKMGSTKSFKGMVDNNYYWTLSKAGAAPQGQYYAQMPATASCKGDRSDNYELVGF